MKLESTIALVLAFAPMAHSQTMHKVQVLVELDKDDAVGHFAVDSIHDAIASSSNWSEEAGTVEAPFDVSIIVDSITIPQTSAQSTEASVLSVEYLTGVTRAHPHSSVQRRLQMYYCHRRATCIKAKDVIDKLDSIYEDSLPTK
jgi:hypothetical protein